MAAGLVDDGDWPLVVVRWPAGHVSDGEVEAAMAQLGSFYGRRHAVLHDAQGIGGVTLHSRRTIVSYSLQHEEEVRRWVVASAVVTASAITRALVKTVQWMAPPPSPFRAFAEFHEAREWLLQALRRAGLWRPSSATP